MNCKPYIGCRVTFAFVNNPPHKANGKLIYAGKNDDGDEIVGVLEGKDLNDLYVFTVSNIIEESFHAYMKPKDMNREQEFEYARSVCEKDGNMGFVGIDRCTDTDRIVYVDLSVGGMRDYKLDMNAEVDVTELFDEEGE